MKRLPMLALLALVPNILYAQGEAPPTPTDVKPGSITCEDVPYPYPVSYLPLTLYGQDIRMAYMDVPAQGQPNGRTVVLFHGMNFAGFYWGGPIDALRKEGFRVVVPDQIGFGRSSKPIIPYNFHDMARNTRLLLAAAEDRQGVHRRSLDGRHAGGPIRHPVSRRRRARRHLQSRLASSIRATSGRGAASTKPTSATSARPISRFTPASSGTSRTIHRRGDRSSTSIRRFAMHGR